MSKTGVEKLAGFVYVVAGKEESLVRDRCGKLVDGLLGADERAMGLFNVDTKGVLVSEVLDELRTVPFLTQRRVVLIKGADKFISENRGALEKYFDNPCSTGVLILGVNSWKSNTKLAKKLSKAGKLIKVEPPKAWQLPDKLIQYAREVYEKSLSRDAAGLLVELAGDQLGRLYSEIDKLALYVEDRKSITAKDIELLVGHNRMFGAFAVIDAVTAGDTMTAIGRMRKMFAEDKSTEFTFVGAFAYHFRRMFNAKVLLEKGTNAATVAKQLGIWGNKEGFFRQVGRMPLRRIGRTIQKLARIDHALKTGGTKAPVVAEQLILELAAK